MKKLKLDHRLLCKANGFFQQEIAEQPLAMLIKWFSGGGWGGCPPLGVSRGRSPLWRLHIWECGGCLLKFKLK